MPINLKGSKLAVRPSLKDVLTAAR